MTWREALLTLQLAAEERVGFVMRESARLARGEEDRLAGQLQDAANANR